MILPFDNQRDVDEDTDESISHTRMMNYTPWQYGLKFASNNDNEDCMAFNV